MPTPTYVPFPGSARVRVPRTYQEWYNAVIGRGNRPTYFRSGPNIGKLSESYRDRRGVWRFALAPVNIQALAPKSSAPIAAAPRGEQPPPGLNVYQRWVWDVRRRGYLVTTMPPGSGYPVGTPAQRSPTPENGQFVYTPAPRAVQEYVARQQRGERRDVQRQENVEAVQNALVETGKDVARVPRGLASAVTGIPEWAIPVLIIGGGFMVLNSFLPAVRR